MPWARIEIPQGYGDVARWRLSPASKGNGAPGSGVRRWTRMPPVLHVDALRFRGLEAQAAPTGGLPGKMDFVGSLPGILLEPHRRQVWSQRRRRRGTFTHGFVRSAACAGAEATRRRRR
jgi:hypothetical protein